MAKDPDLIKMFGVEGMITPKTLSSETMDDIERKTPMAASEDLKPLVDELRMRAVSGDIIGMEICINAMQLRIDYMQERLAQIKRMTGQ